VALRNLRNYPFCKRRKRERKTTQADAPLQGYITSKKKFSEREHLIKSRTPCFFFSLFLVYL
jgi:hypothetical protein